MSLKLSDLLYEKPLTLILWDYKEIPQVVTSFLSSETEIRTLSSLEVLNEWLRLTEVKYIIVASPDEEKFKRAKEILDQEPIDQRRKIFIIFISPFFKTLDPKETFLYGANLLINEKDLSNFEKILNKGKAYWNNLYKPYFQTLEKLTGGI